MLNRHRFPVFAPNAAQSIANLAHGGQRFDTVKHARQDVLSAAGGLFKFDQRVFTCGRISSFAQRPQPFHLVLLDLRINAQGLYL